MGDVLFDAMNVVTLVGFLLWTWADGWWVFGTSEAMQQELDAWKAAIRANAKAAEKPKAMTRCLYCGTLRESRCQSCGAPE